MIVLPHISIPPLSAEERRRAIERQLTGCLGFLPDYRILKGHPAGEELFQGPDHHFRHGFAFRA